MQKDGGSFAVVFTGLNSVGRGEQNDIVVEDKTVSTSHLVLRMPRPVCSLPFCYLYSCCCPRGSACADWHCTSDGAHGVSFLEDVGSTNGTYLGDEEEKIKLVKGRQVCSAALLQRHVMCCVVV